MRYALALALVLSLSGCHPAEEELPPGTARTVLHVEGMTCGGCEATVKGALTKLEGVEAAEVSHKNGRTSVTYDPDEVSPEELLAAIRSAGYKASLEDTSRK